SKEGQSNWSVVNWLVVGANAYFISLMEDNIDYDGQKRGKREDPSPNLIATDGDSFCKKRNQAVN
nr:hypothetical protein [Tanacetum cinerariifolium]